MCSRGSRKAVTHVLKPSIAIHDSMHAAQASSVPGHVMWVRVFHGAVFEPLAPNHMKIELD